MQVEVLQSRSDWDHSGVQARFDQRRQVYHYQRPPQALRRAVSASRYQISARPFPEVLPSIDYGTDAIVRGSRPRQDFLSQPSLSAQQSLSEIPGGAAAGDVRKIVEI